jgi:hypothetical protein
MVVQLLAARGAAVAHLQISGHHRAATAAGAAPPPAAQQRGQQQSLTGSSGVASGIAGGIQVIGRAVDVENQVLLHALKIGA